MLKTDVTKGKKKTETVQESQASMSARVKSEIIAWFWVILAFMLINGTLGQARVIPSGSMENTLLIGDHLIMSRLGYDAGVPFTNWHVPLWRSPHRQQIIIFKPPFDPTQPDYVKRVMIFWARRCSSICRSTRRKTHGTVTSEPDFSLTPMLCFIRGPSAGAGCSMCFKL